MIEIWKDIKGYEGRYQISNLGRVKSLCRLEEKIMHPVTTKKGYLQVRLSSGQCTKGLKVHRLVALNFIPNPNDKPEVNHLDGNKKNNLVTNLEWCTPKENMGHASQNNLLRDVSGNKNPNCKRINQYTTDGKFIKTWCSIFDITKELGAERHGICKCCTNKIKTYRGYIWEYASK